jgi:hypothetical protein
VGRASENPAEQVAARWTRVRHELEREGLDAALVEQVGERLQEVTHEPGEVRRTLVVAGGRIVFDEVQPGHNPAPEVLEQAALPDLAAWLTAEEQVLPFVLAKVDREGADLEVHRAVSGVATDEESVTGQTFNITKVAVGDWAQRQYQQYAENAWEQNAREVAESIVTMARKHATSAVMVAGEVRARSEVMKALQDQGAEIGPYLELESGGRAAGASEEALWADVREQLRTLQAARDADVAAQLDEARGRGEGAATGLEEVLPALAKAQVDRLVLDLAAIGERTVDVGRYDGLALPPGTTGELPADRVLVAAGALSGADVTLLPASMARGGGASALLRWAD